MIPSRRSETQSIVGKSSVLATKRSGLNDFFGETVAVGADENLDSGSTSEKMMPVWGKEIQNTGKSRRA